MNLSFLTSFFKKEKKTLSLPESLLVKKLKTITLANDLYVYSDIVIYHHTKSFFIPLLILDVQRGIYLFEYKKWTYDELKNSHIEKASNQTSSKETLAFENSHQIIRQKFNELTHNDGVPIYNYLLMENLNADEYEHLNDSFKELLPKEKIMFSDSSNNDILNKLATVPLSKIKLPSVANIMGNILIQYTILDKNKNLSMVTEEEKLFLDADTLGMDILYSPMVTEKNNTLVLKIIFEKLKNPDKKIVVVEPTILACDILKKKILESIERAIVEIDITSIIICTPKELVNIHLEKLKKPLLENEVYISEIIMKKKFNIADLLICDDSDYYKEDFLAYVKHIQEKSNLIMISSTDEENAKYSLKGDSNNCQNIMIQQTLPYPKTMHIILQLLKTESSKDIVVVSNSINKENLREDLEGFIKEDAILIESSKNLIDQDLDNLLLCNYKDISGLCAKFIILLDICEESYEKINYAISLAEEKCYVLYEEECENIYNLRKIFENCKN